MSDKRAEIVEETRRVVEELTSRAFMFTALDVSNEVKRTVHGVRHREISPVVRELFEKGAMGPSYTRTTIDVLAGDKKVQALLYYEKSDDPADYDGSLRQQQAIPPTPSSLSGAEAAPPSPAAPQASGPAKIALQLDREGQAIVPRALLEQAGLTGRVVHLDSADMGSGLVLTVADPAADPLAELERDGDAVLIPRRYLSAFDASAPIVAHLGAGVIEITGQVR
ncbi:hypothetical protein [Paraliomyxa miuraensis]|uniref:hypothetical protein n=1 Tax=Paraliomyxa miuraensis TaxID=376150 RepID=UPI0022583526|nr:hypothetical protein [Paraliomyxa miuraensis]MCX4242686.1 hypothetical protein [Paraliomyxa miuraensis]